METEEYHSAKGVAKAMGIDARTLRKFLRSKDSPFEAVGQGGRYAFDDEDVELLKQAWKKSTKSKKSKPKTKAQPKEDPTPEPEDDDPDSWKFEEPTDEELEELDIEELE